MNKMPCDAAQLLEELAKARDPEGTYQELYGCFHRLVFAYFRRSGSAIEDCEDLVQETFLRAFRRLSDFRGRSRFETWLYEIAKNVRRNRIRNQNAAKRDMEEVPLERSWNGNPENGGEISVKSDERDALEILLSKEEKQLVVAEVKSMPPRMRQSFQLYCQDLKFREIAELLQVSIDAVKSQLGQAKKRIREALSDYRSNDDRDPKR